MCTIALIAEFGGFGRSCLGLRRWLTALCWFSFPTLASILNSVPLESFWTSRSRKRTLGRSTSDPKSGSIYNRVLLIHRREFVARISHWVCKWGVSTVSINCEEIMSNRRNDKRNLLRLSLFNPKTTRNIKFRTVLY